MCLKSSHWTFKRIPKSISTKSFRISRNAVKLTGKTYASTHLKHLWKYEAASFELQAAFESSYAWLKRAQYCSIWTTYLGITTKEPDFCPSNLIFFSGKNLKCFVTDCKRGHQSKTAVFQLSCQVLVLCSFPYQMRAWISKLCPQKFKSRSLPPPPTDHSWVGEII